MAFVSKANRKADPAETAQAIHSDINRRHSVREIRCGENPQERPDRETSKLTLRGLAFSYERRPLRE